MSIKVSIIIPAYNVEKYIEQCVRSAMQQTLQAIEIIVVNDGSPDNVQAIVEKLCLEDARIILINKENGGLSSARNAGLDIAKGEYIQHLDGDDWIELDACEAQYTCAIENNLDIVVTDFFGRKAVNGNWINTDLMQGLPLVYSGKEYLRNFLDERVFPCMCNKFIRKTIYKKIRFPLGISLGEDFVVSAKVLYSGERVGKLKKPFFHYRDNQAGLTSNGDEKGYERVLACYDVWQFIKKQPDSDIYIQGINKQFKGALWDFVRSKKVDANAYKEAEQAIIAFGKEQGTIPVDSNYKRVQVKRNEKNETVLSYIT